METRSWPRNLELIDFQVPLMPKLGSHGLRRAIRFKVWDTHAKTLKDGVMVEFSIPKVVMLLRFYGRL